MADNETYDIADDDESATPQPTRARPAPKPDAAQRDSAEVDADGDDEDDLLPPPLSRETNPKPWFVAAACAAGVLLIAWLAGARPLAPIDIGGDGESVVRELTLGPRLIGFARTLVFLPLATLAVTFGVLALAFVRQRPIGDGLGLLARCAAIAAIGMLAWLAPVEIRVLKNSINFLGPPLIAATLSMPLFRIDPRDAGLVAGFSVLGLGILALFANVVVWAIGST